MTTLAEINQAIDKIGTAYEEYKKTNDLRIAALEKGNKSEVAELEIKLGKIDKDIVKFDGLKTSMEREMEFQRNRLELLEARASNPKKTATDVLNDEYKSAFNGWIRSKGQDYGYAQKMDSLAAKARLEHKDITIGTPSAGGYAVPEEISRTIEQLELKFSPVRRLVKVVQVGTSDYKELVSLRGASSGWVGETGSRVATDTPTLREVVPTHGELYAYPQVSEWSLDDIFFNVESWLTDEVAQEFALQEGAAVISGNGSSKPTGMLNTTPVLTADFASPLRAAAAYQYIVSDTDADDSPASPGIRADTLIDTVYALNSAYRSEAQWIMNSLTTAGVRKLKDTTGQYHWQPGLQVGQPAMLLGYPVETWEQMPDIAANAFPIGFGAWRRAYLLVDRVGLRITRDNVTNIGFVRFYVRRREGGIVLNNDAAKFIRTIQ
jgi:HK97 family phage major capsid protein